MGYPAPALGNLHGSTQSYINSLEPLRNPLQNKLSSEKQKMQEQAWRMISLIKPEFCEYKLNDIFLAAIQSIPTSKEDASQIFTDFYLLTGESRYRSRPDLYAALYGAVLELDRE